MWCLECKGYCTNNDTFTAIIPVWSDYSKRCYMNPVNHIRATGVIVENAYFDHNFNKEWHPDNPFSEEKWIECSIILCKWIWNERGEYVIESVSNPDLKDTAGESGVSPLLVHPF